MDEDITETLKKYPPNEICDEWNACADYCDRHAMDMSCIDCDLYYELIELEKNEKLFYQIKE